MPDLDIGNRGLPQWLPRACIWVGIGAAPLAGLLLLIGGAGQRLGGFLGMLAVVAIGLSIALRPEPVAATAGVEERLYEEIDALRAELRAEIEHATRNGHHALEERLMGLVRQVEMLRAGAAAPAEPFHQVSSVAGAAAVAAAAVPIPAEPSARGRIGGPVEVEGRSAWHRPEPAEVSRPITGSVYRHTETVQVTRSTYVDTGTFPRPTDLDHSYPESSWPEPTRAAADAPAAERWRERPEERYASGRPGRRAARYSDDHHSDDRYPEERYPDDRYPEDPQPSEDRYAESRYADASPHSDSRPAPSRRYPEDGRYSKRDRYNDRDRYDDRGRYDGRGQYDSRAPYEDRGQYGRRGRYDSGEWSNDQWGESDAGSPELRTGQRWASVRTSSDGRELQLGERRVARHRDEYGDEVRIEDRWAAVQQSDRGRGRPRHADPVEVERPALPPGGGTTWSEGWSDAATSAGRGRRSREPEHPYRTARPEFDDVDHHWR